MKIKFNICIFSSAVAACILSCSAPEANHKNFPTSSISQSQKPEKTVNNGQTQDINPAQHKNINEVIIARLNNIKSSATQGEVTVSADVSGSTLDDSFLTYRQKTLTTAPAGSYTVQADYRIPLSILKNTKSRIENTELEVVMFILEAPLGEKPFNVTVREFSTGFYNRNTNQGDPVTGKESYFGFTFPNRMDAEDFEGLWRRFVMNLE